jgi:hypothetical protein
VCPRQVLKPSVSSVIVFTFTHRHCCILYSTSPDRAIVHQAHDVSITGHTSASDEAVLHCNGTEITKKSARTVGSRWGLKLGRLVAELRTGGSSPGANVPDIAGSSHSWCYLTFLGRTFLHVQLVLSERLRHGPYVHWKGFLCSRVSCLSASFSRPCLLYLLGDAVCAFLYTQLSCHFLWCAEMESILMAALSRMITACRWQCNCASPRTLTKSSCHG